MPKEFPHGLGKGAHALREAILKMPISGQFTGFSAETTVGTPHAKQSLSKVSVENT